MCKKRGFNVAGNLVSNVLKSFVSRVALVASADEGDTNDTTNNTTGEGDSQTNDGEKKPSINFEDLVSKARQDEKNKQRGKIDRLTAQVNELTEKNNTLMLKVGELESNLAEAEKKLTQASSGDSEEVKTLKAEIENLKSSLDSANKELKQFKDTPPVDRDALEKEIREEVQKEYEINLYRIEKIAPYVNDKTFVSELVVGDTKEAIDTSFEAALERSKEMKQSLGFKADGTPDNRRTPKATGNPASQPTGGDGIKALADINPRTNPEEYAKLRSQLGFK